MKQDFDMDGAPFNPKRVVIGSLGAVALLIALYLGLYQWGFIDKIPDPLFGNQVEKVLNSDLSHILRRWFRIPDGIMGAIVYLGVVVFSLAGSNRRWQERPWLVLLMGMNLIGLEIASLSLIFAQAALIKSWCFFCLVNALIAQILLVLAYEELMASASFLFAIWKENRDLRLLFNTFLGKASFVAYKTGEELLQKRRVN
jgi:uncharacterized membrane protein